MLHFRCLLEGLGHHFGSFGSLFWESKSFILAPREALGTLNKTSPEKETKLVKMCGPQHVDKNGIHNILTDARVLVFGIYVSILLLPCLWAGCLGLDVEKMMPTNEDLHSPLFYGSASLQPPPHQQKEGGNVTPHF